MPTDPAIRDLVDRFATDAVALAAALKPFLLEFAKEVASIQRDVDARTAEAMSAPTVAQAIRGER